MAHAMVVNVVYVVDMMHDMMDHVPAMTGMARNMRYAPRAARHNIRLCRLCHRWRGRRRR